VNVVIDEFGNGILSGALSIIASAAAPPHTTADRTHHFTKLKWSLLMMTRREC